MEFSHFFWVRGLCAGKIQMSKLKIQMEIIDNGHEHASGTRPLAVHRLRSAVSFTRSSVLIITGTNTKL
jgi:hypothetical protein